MLDEHPLLGRAGRIKGTRELVAHPNYILFYRVVKGAAEAHYALEGLASKVLAAEYHTVLPNE